MFQIFYFVDVIVTQVQILELRNTLQLAYCG